MILERVCCQRCGVPGVDATVEDVQLDLVRLTCPNCGFSEVQVSDERASHTIDLSDPDSYQNIGDTDE